MGSASPVRVGFQGDDTPPTLFNLDTGYEDCKRFHIFFYRAISLSFTTKYAGNTAKTPC